MYASSLHAIKFNRWVLTLALAGAFVAPTSAGGLRELDQTIFGMDCAPCAAGVEQGLSKLHGVTSVRVSLNEGKAVVELAPDSRTTLAQIREVIRHNGFTPKDARATVAGRLVRESDRLFLEAGDERFVLKAESTAVENQTISAAVHQQVVLSVRIPEKLTTPPTVHLLALEQRI